MSTLDTMNSSGAWTKLGFALWTAPRDGRPREVVHAGPVRLSIDLPRQPLSDDERLRDQGPTPQETRTHVRRQWVG